MQEEDSSSPSDNLKLVQADRTGAAGERIKLQLSDGSCFFVSDSDLQQYGLSGGELVPDLELPTKVVENLKRSALIHQVREKALQLLARAPHSTFSLRMKLLKRNFDRGAVQEVLRILREEKYLDDEDFAENWLRSRAERRPEGRAVLIAGLRNRGVPREIAEGVVKRFLTPEREWENAVRALEKLKRSGEADPAALKTKLQRRGFPFPLIRRLIDEQAES